MSMFGPLTQDDWGRKRSIKSKYSTRCTRLVIISSVHTVQKQHHPAVITLQNITSHHPPPVKAQPQWVKGEMIKVKSFLIEWTPSKKVPSTAWTLPWKSHVEWQVTSRLTAKTVWPSANEKEKHEVIAWLDLTTYSRLVDRRSAFVTKDRRIGCVTHTHPILTGLYYHKYGQQLVRFSSICRVITNMHLLNIVSSSMRLLWHLMPTFMLLSGTMKRTFYTAYQRLRVWLYDR